MDPKQKNDAATQHITHVINEAKSAFENGNRNGAAYLACIAGMWWNACKLRLLDPFADDFLNSWFTTGYDAYTQSIGMTVELRKKMVEYEAEWAKKHPKGAAETEMDRIVKQASIPEPKKSIWDVKLW